MSCCNISKKPTAQEVVPGVAKFALVFLITIVSVFCIVSALLFISGS